MTSFRDAIFNGSSGDSGMIGNTSYKQVSPMTDPTFAKLFGQTQAAIPTNVPGLESLIQGGMNSPLLQLILGPAMQRLQAPQAAARSNLTEATRAAGGLRGSTYGQDYNTLQNNQALQTNDLMAQVIQQVLGTLVSGQLQSQQNQFLPGQSLTNLLRTVAPQTVTGNTGSSGTSSISGPDMSSLSAVPWGGGNSAQSYFNTPGYGVGQPAMPGSQTASYNPAQDWKIGMGGSGIDPNAPVIKPPPQYVDPFGANTSGSGGTINNNAMTGWASDVNGQTPASIFANWTAEFERNRAASPQI